MFGAAYGNEAMMSGQGVLPAARPLSASAKPRRIDMDVDNRLAMTVEERFVAIPGGRLCVRQWQLPASGKTPSLLHPAGVRLFIVD